MRIFMLHGYSSSVRKFMATISQVKKGGIKSLINLLSSSQDNEAQRFAALAIGNVASAPFVRSLLLGPNDVTFPNRIGWRSLKRAYSRHSSLILQTVKMIS